MTPKEREAMQQALEALETIIVDDGHWELNETIGAITTLREALAEQAEQEPVAEVIVRPLRGDQSQPTTDIKWLQQPKTGKLYAAPVRTKDLTDEEIAAHWAVDGFYQTPTNFARAVIAADREKNK